MLTKNSIAKNATSENDATVFAAVIIDQVCYLQSLNLIPNTSPDILQLIGVKVTYLKLPCKRTSEITNITYILKYEEQQGSSESLNAGVSLPWKW